MNFKYRGRNPDGEVVEGQVDAENQGLALEALRQRGVLVLSLNEASSAPKRPMTFFDKLQRIGTVTMKTKMIFFRQMATMIKAGLSLAGALDIVAEQERSLIFRDVVLSVKGSIDRGIPFSQAMREHKVFTPMMSSLVQAGEEGGLLDNALDRVAVLLERQVALTGRIRAAMFYPAFILLFAFGIVVVFILFILPKFRQVFDSMGIELPALTQTLFNLGDYFSTYWAALTGAVFAVVSLLIWALRSPVTKPFMDRLTLRLPVIKSLVFKAGMARASLTLASLVTAGVPILKGLEMAEEVAGNDVIRAGFAHLQNSARSGQNLGEAARQAKVFSPLICQMMRIGEETGHLDEMLERVAVWYGQELDEQIKAMTALMEPVMILVVGGIVALISLAIFGPIVSAMSQMM